MDEPFVGLDPKASHLLKEMMREFCDNGGAIFVSLKLKHKSMITVLVSLVFIVSYYFVYFKTQSMITELLTNLTVYGDKIKGSAYLLFAFGSVGVGGVKATLIMLTFVAVTFLMMWFLISKSFLQVATSTGKVSKVVYHKKTMKQESVTKALLFREFWHFTSSPGYMLNSGLGIFLMPVCAAGLIWKGRKLFTMLNGMFGSQDGTVLLLVTIMLCGLISMNIMTAPSISLEGKSLFIGYMMLHGYTLGYMLYIGIFIVVNVVAGLTLYIWLKTKGCDRFAEL